MPIMTFKVSEAEAQAIRAKARAARAQSVSSYLRKQALGEEPRKKRIVLRRHPVSGLLCNAAKRRTVTAQEIKAALADFP